MGRAGAAMWARADVCARWKALVALGLLVGVTAGFAIAAYAGARRTDASFPRLRETTAAADAVVFATQTQAFIIDTKLWDDLEARPEVEHVAPWVLALGKVTPGDDFGVIMGPYDDRWLQKVDRPVVVRGRMWDPKAADEIVIDEEAARHEDLDLGDEVTYHAFTMDQIRNEEGGEPKGPLVRMKIVGIVRTVQPFVFTSLPMMSPGVIAKYGQGDNPIAFGTNAMVKLRDGAAGVPELQRDVNEMIEDGTPLLDLHEVQRRVDTTLDVEAAALRLLALAIVLAGGLLVGQALSRSAATIQFDAPALRGMGLTRREMALAALRAHGLVGILGVASAAAVAIVASRWFPVGFAAGIDPDRGMHADWLVLGLGAVATALFVAAVVGVSAHRAVRTQRTRPSRRTTGFVDGVQRRTPVSVGIGTAMVMERGRARVNIPIRQAIVGAVVGVVGVVATLTINANLHDAVAHPERAGVTFDGQVFLGDEAGKDVTYDPVLAALETSSDVDAYAFMVRELIPVEDIGIPTFALEAVPESRGEPISFTMLNGRPPADGEAVIGPKTARGLDVRVGDTVTIGSNQQRVRIVGEALFPPDVHSEFDEGLWVTPAQLERSEPPNPQYGRAEVVVLRLNSGVDSDQFGDALGAQIGDDFDIAASEIPYELTNLRYVRTLPIVLAVFLGLLALAALLHVLLTVARTRRSEFAVLRALGMTRRSTRAVVNVQGTTVAAIGLVVGIPLGVLLGREIWHLIAASVPIEEVSKYEWLAVGAVALIAVAAANLLALWPGRRAARLQPAEVLRSE